MGRDTAALVWALAALLATGCGDPMVVIGDAPGIVRIVAGIPETAGDSLGAVATRSHLNAPRGLAAGPDGVLYIADQKNSRVLAVASSGAIDVLADHSGRVEEPRLHEPDGLALSDDGRLYIADSDGHRIWLLDPSTGNLSVIAGTGARGSSPDTIDALLAELDTPAGIAVDSDGRVYFSEFGRHRVRVIRDDGTLVTIAGVGLSGSGGDGGPATRARLRRPAGLAYSRGVLYIADSGNNVVRAVVLGTGTIDVVAGRGPAGFDGDGGPADEALLNKPLAVALAPDGGTLFIGDADNHRVRVVNLGSSTITTFAGTGEEQFNGDLLSAGETSLNLPAGLVVSSFNFLYISDLVHHVVRRSAVRFMEAL